MSTNNDRPRFATRDQYLNAQAALLALRLGRAWQAVADALAALPDKVLVEQYRQVFGPAAPGGGQLARAITACRVRLDESAAGACGLSDLDVRPCDALALYAQSDLARRGKANAAAALHSAMAAGMAALHETTARKQARTAAATSMDHLRKLKAS